MIFQYDVAVQFKVLGILQVIERIKNNLNGNGTRKDWQPIDDGAG